jgi:hypothetical protein
MTTHNFSGKIIAVFFSSLLILGFPLEITLAGPSTGNYELKEYGFGSGGTSGSSTENYSLFGTTGEVDQGVGSTNNYKNLPGLTMTMQADLPPAPTVTNPANFYNKLHLIINISDNPTDAKFAIAASTDNFVSDTRYVQNNNTIGAVLGTEDWQTYTGWGSGDGITIIGLSPGTTYSFKVAAVHGDFSQSGFGPVGTAATINPTLTFDIDVSSVDEETNPPFAVSLGSLTASTVTTASNKVWVDVSTNGTSGALVYVYGSNNGLLSTSTSNSIISSTADLASGAVTEGYGAKYNSVAESAGGPMQPVSPYNGASDSVGVLDTSKRLIFDSSNLPVTSGRASFLIKAKASAVTEAATDYTDTITVIAAATY